MPNEEEIIVDDTETTVNDVQEGAESEVAPQEDVEELKKKIQTLEAQKEHWREKAEKKGSTQEAKQPVKEAKQELSTLEIIALSKANVDTEDMSEVIKWARYNNVPINDALKSPELNAVLGVRKEMRTTAEASNTGASRRQTGKLSDDALLSMARSGKSDNLSDADLDRLVGLHYKSKVGKR